MNFQSVKDNETRAIVYCRSDAREDLQRQKEKILSYAKMQGTLTIDCKMSIIYEKE